MHGQVVPAAYAVKEPEPDKEVVLMVLLATRVMVHYSLRMMLLAVTLVVSFLNKTFSLYLKGSRYSYETLSIE